MLFLEHRPGPAAGATGGCQRWARCWTVAVALMVFPGHLFAAELQDMFAARETVDTESGLVIGDNLTATLESDEPRHGGRTGGASVWISWVAPTNGIVTFSTGGSGLDTLLAAYYHDDDGTGFDELEEAAENDDDESGGTSVIVFGVRAGERYEIAIDGYRGARGGLQLRWQLEATPDLPPIILSTPEDQAVQAGVPVSLTVALENPSAYNLHWFLNDEELEEEDATLFIPSLARTNLGQYRLRLSLGDFRIFSRPIELQINSEGQPDSLVRDKIYDAFDPVLGTGTALGGKPGATRRPKAPAPRTLDAVNRGYNGSQLFSSVKATASADEPSICGQAGAVTWFAYEPPAAGTLMLNTDGSEVGVSLAAFTFDGALTNVSQLRSITCDPPPAIGFVSEIEFAVEAGRSYVVGLVGAGDQRGVIKLNYALDLNRPPVPPGIVFGGSELTFAAGGPVTLIASAEGSPPLQFDWFKNGVALGTTDAPAWHIPAAGLADVGAYAVQVRNHLGSAASGLLHVRVLIPPAIQLAWTGGRLRLSVTTAIEHSYQLEYREPSRDGFWQPLGPGFAGTGGTVTLTNDPPSTSDAWFRVRVN